MTGLLKRESKGLDKVEAFDWFDRMFDDWTRMLPFRRPTNSAGIGPPRR
jgi:hypothetical protein